MSEFPSLSEVLARHQWRGEILGCDCGWDWPEQRTYFCGEDARIAKAHIEHQAEMWRESCTIRTAEELDVLPDFAIVGFWMPALADNRGRHLFALEKDVGWFGVGSGDEISDGGLSATLDATGPALLIWHPSWARS